MNSPSWFILAVGTLMIPSAYASARGDHGVTRGPAITPVVYQTTDTRSSLTFSSDFSTTTSQSAPIDRYAITAAFPSENCRGGSCGRPQQSQFAAFGDDRRFERSAYRGDAARTSDRSSGKSSAMTALDLGLMMLFAFGLVAYQLGRKQRLLRQSALIPASLDRSQAVATDMATGARDSTLR